ncbi:CDK-activating kinase assembly factor MAT1-like [Gigantopelta aegis]|uniref:CDK-activating kinase assembly factor MAT1-like n=1 Tax=Gigantopelta aegis TaxID=1735272 RepID=UPI001B88E5F3|nr:CDK-activating kinase assembly factor MAT1-like [Gigantopelta aegis]
MDEPGCPRCKTTKYSNPSLKLLVNICGHPLCESCVDLLFVKGSGNCPECGTTLRRINFRLQIFEDPVIEKEVDIRKRVLRDFNKKEEDFEDLRAYNDYLEMVETIINNLVHGVEMESTRKMIDQYKKENKEQIKKNLSKLSKDEEYLEMLIEQEREESVHRKQIAVTEQKLEVSAKKRNKKALIDELMFSDLPADAILASHRDTTTAIEVESSIPKDKAMHFSTGIKIGHQDRFLPVPKEEEVSQYTYTPFELENCGPHLPSLEDIIACGYLSNVRSSTDSERGGGFEASIACQRALQDAFNGLFFCSDLDNLQEVPMVT